MSRNERLDNRRENSKKRNQLPFLILLAVLILVLIGVIFIAKEKNPSQSAGIDPSTQEETESVEKWQEGVIKYKDKYYQYNNNIKTYLFMGIDKEQSDGEVVGEAGQSDAMFLLVANEDEKSLSIIAIHRNAMTDVDVYGDSGAILKTVNAQICTQYAFGDGKFLSCDRATKAVSKLFYNLPISGYLSMQMGGISIMNDVVGGVEVEVLHDLVDASKGVDLKAGEMVRLTGDEAYVYLRSRDIDEFDSATNRLLRQQQYITNFANQVNVYTAGSTTKALDIYEAIEDYVITNIDFADLALKLDGYEYDSSRMYSLPGETQMGEKLEEYHVDDDALYALIIDVFYKEVEM